MVTEEPTSTATPIPTPTPTATPDFYILVQTPAGADARISREASVVDLWVLLLLFAILVSMWLMYILNRLKGVK